MTSEGSSGPGEASARDSTAAGAPAAQLLNGLQWALALLLLLQALFSVAIPGVTDLMLARILASRGGACIGPCEATLTPFLPWAVFGALHLLQVRQLRLRGPFPFGDGQVLGLALVPGYNLAGSVALFTAEGEALERLGAGRGLARQLRLAASLASGLAVAQVVLVLHGYRSALAWNWFRGPEVVLPGVALSWVTLALLLARLFVLARLQLANHRLQAASPSPAAVDALPAHPALPSEEVRALLEPRLAMGVAALAGLAAGLALVPPGGSLGTSWWPARGPTYEESQQAIIGDSLRLVPPPPAPSAHRAPAIEQPRAAIQAPAIPRNPASTAGTPGRVASPPAAAPAPEPRFGGRTVGWWSDRLRLLHARQDAEGRRLYALTRDRAEANGLELLDEAAGPRAAVAPAPGTARGAGP